MTTPYLNIPEKYDRTIIVGDIHGCIVEFTKLLEKVRFSKHDLLIAVGDLVDRGPGTWEVVKFFHDTPNAVSVLGNHERRLAGTVFGTSQPAWSQRHSLSMLPADQHAFWAGYLQSLPAVIECDQAIVTHARLDPTVRIDRQDPYYTCAVGGSSVVIRKDRNGVPEWYLQWKKRFPTDKTICFGHSYHDNAELVANQLYALDKGAARGGYLTAITLPDHNIVKIKSETNYYAESLSEWSASELGNLAPEQLPIHSYFSIIGKKEKSEIEKRTVEAFEDYLDTLGIHYSIDNLKQSLLATFGPVPLAGSARGRYFQTIRAAIPSANQKLINMALASATINITRFLRLFEGNDLIFVCAELNAAKEMADAYGK